MMHPFIPMVSHKKAPKGSPWPVNMLRAPIGALRVTGAGGFLRLLVAKPALVERV
jgi:hypothetical protein